MPRYVFTARDLSRFLPLLGLPNAGRLIEHMRPIKQGGARRGYTADLGRLAIEVQGSKAPDGVPLASVLSLLKSRVGVINALVVRNGRLEVISERPLSSEERDAIRKVIADRDTLERARVEDLSQAALSTERLAEVLKDPRTSDAEWIRAFRQYATNHLFGGAEADKLALLAALAKKDA